VYFVAISYFPSFIKTFKQNICHFVSVKQTLANFYFILSSYCYQTQFNKMTILNYLLVSMKINLELQNEEKNYENLKNKTMNTFKK